MHSVDIVKGQTLHTYTTIVAQFVKMIEMIGD